MKCCWVWLCSGVVLAMTMAAVSSQAQTYGVYREVFLNVQGNAVADLTNSPNFPVRPDLTNVITDYFEAPHDWADNYGTRLRALVLPPINGDYTFWIASDDNSALYLSTDENPANRFQIASVATWTGLREWSKETNQKSAPISLAGGRRYYLEALQKEGGGGDNLSVGWQLPDATQELPIPASRSFPFTGLVSAPPAIVIQPANTAAADGRSAFFAVLVSDPVPVTYQWQQSGSNIAGATNSTYTLPVATTNLTGTLFRCAISNAVGGTISAAALLSVFVDTNPPAIVSVANLGLAMVRIVFSEPVEPATATNSSNYSLSGGVTISGAVMATDPQTVLLSVSGLTLGMTYTQTVSNVRDLSSTHNVIPSNSKFVFSPLLPGIFREVFMDIGGSAVADLTNSIDFPTNPAVAYLVTDYFESPVGVGVNYGQRWRGLIVPPTTGNYVFGIASDDASVLYLSTDDTPVHKAPIASVNGWTGFRQWTTETNQQSLPIALSAGRQYYLEALHKQGGGGDDFTVRWQLPSGAMEEPIPASRLSPVGMSAPLITAQPASITVAEGDSPVFTVQVSNRDPISYQWRKNGVNVPGATNAMFTNLFVNLTDNNAHFRCLLANALGSTNTTDAILTVTPDRTPPTIIKVQNIGTTNVQIFFSERVEPASATNTASYVFINGVAVTFAAFAGDPQTIVLTTSPLTIGSNYTLVVNNVRDRAVIPNTIATNTTASFTAVEYANQDIGNSVPPGGLTTVAGGFDVRGGGNDIGGALDQFGFSFQKRTGDFDVQVQILGLSPSDVWAKAGLMARETLEANSRFAAAIATPSLAGAFFSFRDPAGGNAVTSGNQRLNYPNQWLRLQRASNQFTGFASYDGRTWTLLGSASLAMSSTVYFGMAVASHNSAQTAAAQFRGLTSVVGGVLGSPSLRNEPLGPSSRKTALVITEIMYHPAPRADGKSTEFIEVFNSNPYPEDISGYRLSGDVDYTFPPGTMFPGGAFLVVAHNPADLQSVYGFANALGPYTNNLSNKAGTVRLRNRADAILLEVNYDSQPPWPIAADGAGHSLVLARPSFGEADPQAWFASDVVGGSPGSMEGAGFEPAQSVVINEFFAHSVPPDVDFVELYNHSNQPIDLSGCSLSDDPVTNKFRVPNGTMIPPRGFLVFDETQLGFGLGAGGEAIYFVNSNQTRVLDAVRFEAQAAGVASGRSPDGAPQFYPLTTRSPGTNNSPILVREVVLNEIMFNPISGDDNDQYVELYNRGTNAVNLGNWKFTSGISFTFPTNAILPANGYLVVANNVPRLLTNYVNLTAANTVGNFSGTLSHQGERLALAMPEWVVSSISGHFVTNLHYVVADEVTYHKGGRWGQWAAGGGSSLELTDAHSNHRLAPNWSASDETTKAGWTNIEFTGVLDNGLDANSYPADSLQIILTDWGECLVDNVEVYAAGNPNNLIANSTFETGTSNWIFQGTQDTSYWETNGGYASSRSLHVRATERGDDIANRIFSHLTSVIPVGSTATIRAKVKWLKGSPEILFRFRGGWLEAFGRMAVPANLGTPGEPNSRAVANAGPAITDVAHTPAVPSASQPVLVTARVQDPDGLAAVVLKYRLDPATNLTLVLMNDRGTNGDAIAGDGIFSATMAGQPQGTLVAFQIQATDKFTPSATTRFPNDAPARECLILFGDAVPNSTFGTYHLWMTQATFNRWSNREKMSNEPLDVTLAYGNYRAVYNSGSLFSGSPFHSPGYSTPNGNACSYKLIVPDDDQVLGTTDFNKIHWPGNVGGDDTLQREETSYWMAEQLGLPFNHTRYLNLFVNGVQRNAIFEDMQTPGADMLDQWFSTDANGDLYKVSVWAEFADDASGFGARGASLSKFTTTGGVKKTACYRWAFAKRALNGSANDFTDVFALVDALNNTTSSYTTGLDALLDFDEWAGIAAIEHVVGNWDCWLNTGGQNLYIYKPQAGKWQAMIWDINIDLGIGGYSDGPTSDLFKVGDAPLGTLYNNPTFRRAYWRALQNAVDGPLVASKVGPVMDRIYAAFVANGVAAGAPTDVKNWIAQRRAYVIAQLATVSAPFAITNNGGANFSTASSLITLTGTAPVKVKTITVNGIVYPITWTGVTSWTLQVPANGVTNLLVLQGNDRLGNPVSNTTANITVTYTGPLERPQDSLVFNEIMYRPLVTNAEYVELFNRSPAVAFDLSNYRLDGVDFTFPPGASIGPRRFVVVAKDRNVFTTTYGAGLPVVGQYNGKLDPKGELLTLIKPGLIPADDAIINQVRYSSAPPWPAGANSAGSSLQLIDALQDNRRVANWSGNYTPAITNGAWRFFSVTGAAGTSGRLRVYFSTPGDAYLDDLFLADGPVANGGTNFVRNGDFESPLVDAPPLANSYHIGPYYTNSALTTAIKHSGSASLHLVCTNAIAIDSQIIYQDLLPAPTNGQTCTLSFWYRSGASGANLTVRLVGSAGLLGTVNVAPTDTPVVTYLSPGVSNNVSASLPLMPPLWINEVQSENVNGITDTAGELEPWLELYNASTNVVSLSGLYLANTYTNLTQWAFPTNAAINPGEFKVIFADGQPEQSTNNELHANFRLSSGDGSVALSWLFLGQPQVLDYLDYSDISAGHSYGSVPDGQPLVRQEFYYVTPGASNNGAPPPLAVLINEWMADNSFTLADPADGHFDDWFELYNPSTNTAYLAGYYLTDTLTNKFQFQIPSGYSIPPGGYLLVWADGETGQNNSSRPDLHASFQLSKKGEAIGLYAPDGTLVDGVSFGPQTNDVSQGRFPDGSASIYFLTRPTPRAANYVQLPNTPPVLHSIPDAVVNEGQLLLFTATAVDTNLPLQTLSYMLDAGAPTGANVDPFTGLFTWRPTAVQAPSTNAFTLRVTDDGIPPMSDSQSFQVIVAKLPHVSSISLNRGQLSLAWHSFPGRTYQFQYTDDLTISLWLNLGMPVTAGGETLTLTQDISVQPHRFYRVVPAD